MMFLKKALHYCLKVAVFKETAVR